MNIECALVSRWLEPYFDGELGRHRANLVRAHVHRCPSCLHQLKEMEVLRSALVRAAAGIAQPAGFEEMWARLSPMLPQPDNDSTGPQWFERLRRVLIPQRLAWVPVTLALVLVAAIGIFWQIRGTTPSVSNAVIIDYLESRHSSVMVFQPEDPGDMTVIWLFEEKSA
ncbi:MAG: zf-HC2 domain-containing protein [Deltaproteobacteria bacterium]|nr:zf-HC2 domain-containing protein [Deltaproteobacteria bacterium]MBW2308202.1 zf-HC2 domain-containing protein [Deltaproteobacteria bacterium]